MKIKKRHVQMARAAWRTNIWGIAKRYDVQERLFRPLMSFLLDPARQSVMRWHRAAKGKHQ